MHDDFFPPAAEKGSFLQSFLQDTASMSPEERGSFLEEPPEGAPDIDEAHAVRPSSRIKALVLLSFCTTSS